MAGRPTGRYRSQDATVSAGWRGAIRTQAASAACRCTIRMRLVFAAFPRTIRMRAVSAARRKKGARCGLDRMARHRQPRDRLSLGWRTSVSAGRYRGAIGETRETKPLEISAVGLPTIRVQSLTMRADMSWNGFTQAGDKQ